MCDNLSFIIVRSCSCMKYTNNNDFVSSEDDKSYPGFFNNDSEFINGLNSIIAEVKENIRPSESSLVRLTSAEDADETECQYTSEFAPGSVIAFR